MFFVDAQAGPSRSNASMEQPGAKRARIKRSSKACQSCRIRKRKCGGAPPDPCPNCIANEEECSWSVQDGRSSEFRTRKKSAKPSIPASGVTQEEAFTFQQVWLGELGNIDFDLQSGFQDAFNPPELAPLDTRSSFFHGSSTSDASSVPVAFRHPENAALDATFGTLPSEWEDVDPFDMILAMSARMPTVEATGVSEDISPRSSTGRTDASRAHCTSHNGSGKMVKVTWWRPHGQTAIAPGFKRMTLRVRVDDETAGERAYTRSPGDNLAGGPSIELFGAGRAPSIEIMKHLGLIFKDHFGSQIPYVDIDRCIADLEAGNGSEFLLNCIAAVAARFSTHPAIALPSLKPFEYGNVFYDVAKDMLGSMLAVPHSDTVTALLLMSHAGLGNDSEAEEWMFTGMAVRLAVDMGIQFQMDEESGISKHQIRLNRLVFWSVVILDFALAFGTGRQPTFRVSEISQPLPTEQDMYEHDIPPGPPHPFPFAASLMFSYGHLIELLNSREDDLDGSRQREIQKCKMKSISQYNMLPPVMRWNVTNLQSHAQAGRAPIFAQMHLWMHTIIASGHLTGTDYVRRLHNRVPTVPTDGKSGAITPNSMAASNAWRHSARTIGDILVLSDIVSPKAYAALPFCNQAFYVAGSCYVKELEYEREELAKRSVNAGENSENVADLFKSILASVSAENLEKLRQGLAKQTVYWSGVGWVAEALEQRIGGIGASDIDLARAAEKLASFASIPDAGLLHRSEV